MKQLILQSPFPLSLSPSLSHSFFRVDDRAFVLMLLAARMYIGKSVVLNGCVCMRLLSHGAIRAKRKRKIPAGAFITVGVASSRVSNTFSMFLIQRHGAADVNTKKTQRNRSSGWCDKKLTNSSVYNNARILMEIKIIYLLDTRIIERNFYQLNFEFDHEQWCLNIIHVFSWRKSNCSLYYVALYCFYWDILYCLFKR